MKHQCQKTWSSECCNNILVIFINLENDGIIPKRNEDNVLQEIDTLYYKCMINIKRQNRDIQNMLNSLGRYIVFPLKSNSLLMYILY